MIRTLAITAVAVALAGCAQDSQQSQRNSTYDDESDVAIPAASNLKQAEDTGYLDATDPNAYPPTYQ